MLRPTLGRLIASFAMVAAVPLSTPGTGDVTTVPVSATVSRVALSPSRDNGDAPGGHVVIDREGHHDRVAPRRGIRKWPGDTIRYWADLPPSFTWSLDAAIAAWNDTGLDMRFVKASRARAQTRITIGDTHGAAGYATVGYQASNWVHLTKTLVKSWSGASEAYGRVVAAHIIAHELGHNLGLEHSGGCQLMTAVLMLPDCRMMDATKPGYYACRIVDSKALAKTVAMYGGSRTPAPAACPVDPLPPALSGLRFDGGLDEEKPVQLSWSPPAHAPPGSEVLGFVTNGSTCQFPVVQDSYKQAVYDESHLRIKHLDPAAGSWQPAADGTRTHCYGLQLVNRSGAGRTIDGQVLQSWVPKPPTPEVTTVRRFAGDWNAGSYKALVTWTGSSLDLLVLAGPSGQCPSSWPQGEKVADHRVGATSGSPFPLDALDSSYDPIPDPCLSFFLVGDGGRVSDPATWQVGVEPLPVAPALNSVTRTSREEYVPDLAWDYDVATLAAVVRPEGQCVSSWPSGSDPADYAVDYSVTTSVVRPCISFFTVNATGGVSPTAVTWQAPGAPAPPAPSITNLDNSGGYLTGRTDLDPNTFGLAVVEGPTGQCPTTFPAGEDPSSYAAYLYDDGTGPTFEAYTYGTNPCVTFFAFNLDGEVGPGVQKQL